MEPAVAEQEVDLTQGKGRTSHLGPMAWLLIVLLATPVIEAAMKGHFTAATASVTALATVSACLGTLTYLKPSKSPSRTARYARVALIAMCALGTATIRLNLESPEYVPSLFTYSILLLALLVVDGYVRAGLGVGLIILGAALVDAVVTGAGLSVYVSLAYLLAILLLSSAWLYYMRRLVKRGNELDNRSAQLLEQRRSDARELTLLRIRSALTRSGAEDVLTRVLGAEHVDDRLIEDVRLAEARLRDYLSAPIFNHSIFADEVSVARSRGVLVRLLGESPGTKQGAVIGGQLASALIEELQNAQPGDLFIIRYIPGSTPARFTVVWERDQHSTRMEFDARGVKVPWDRQQP